MSKILLVSWSVFPGSTGSCVLVNNIAKAFAKNELVIVGEKPVDNAVERWNTDFPKLRYLDPFTLPSRKGIRYSRWLSYRRLSRELEAIAVDEGCTSVLAVFPDEFWMQLALGVSKRLRLNFYPWFHNTYLDNRKGILKFVANILQPRIFGHARSILVMSEGMKSFFAAKYPKLGFAVLQHGFDIPNIEFAEAPLVRGKVKFLFSGSVNDSCKEACERLFNYILNREDSELYISSGNTMFVEEMNLPGESLHILPFVSFDEFEARLGEFDIMLLTHGFDGARSEAEFKTIFPTRAIPLLYSNRPILAHTPKGAFLTDFLLENDCAEVVSTKNVEDIALGIDTLLTNKSRANELVKNAIETASYFDIEKVVRKIEGLDAA